jgi:3-phenylpropionate/trans-cinnamate dioxygenase alpha subunit
MWNSTYLPENFQEGSGPWPNWHEFKQIRTEDGKLKKVGRVNMNLFPNVFIATSGSNFALRRPVGPTTTEIWMWSFYDRKASEKDQREVRMRAGHHFGPAGIMEQDDGENWDQSTAGVRGVVSERYPLNYSMHVGRGTFIEDEQSPPRIPTHLNENCQLWHYRCWAEMMAADSWAEYRANHSKPGGVV